MYLFNLLFFIYLLCIYLFIYLLIIIFFVIYYILLILYIIYIYLYVYIICIHMLFSYSVHGVALNEMIRFAVPLFHELCCMPISHAVRRKFSGRHRSQGRV